MNQRNIANTLMMACIAVLSVACAKIDDKAMSWVSSTSDAILLVNGRVMVGDVRFRIDHTGTLSVAQPEPPLKADEAAPPEADTTAVEAKEPMANCVGRFRYTSTTAGTVDLRCSDGTVAELLVVMLSEIRGYGYGQSAAGPVSLTFGLAPQVAKAYLRVPPGKRLKELAASPFFELM